MLSKISMLIAGLMMCATTAMAAATAPKFTTPVIVGAGQLIKAKKQSLAFDKTSIYAAYENNGTKVVTSDSTGKKWNQSIAFPGADALSLSQRIAVSRDPLNPAKTIVHVVWKGKDALGEAVFYSFNANMPSQAGWSKPIRALDLSKIQDQSGTQGTNIAVSSSGAVHLVYGRYYVTASAPGVAFSSPSQIQPDLEYTKSALTIDNANNLYVIHMSFDTRSFYLSKKVADAANWSTPVTIYRSSTELSGDFDFTALDSNNSYLAAYEDASENKGNLILLVSNNGGDSWIKRTVVTGTPHGDAENNPTVAVSLGKIITYASEIFDADGLNPIIKVWRSNDNGATWSDSTTVKGVSTPHLALDNSGKVNVLVRDGSGNLLWSKEK